MFFIFANLVCVYGNIKTVPPGISPEPIPDACLGAVPTVRKHPLPLSSFHGGDQLLCIMNLVLGSCVSAPVGLCNTAASLDLWGSGVGTVSWHSPMEEGMVTCYSEKFDWGLLALSGLIYCWFYDTLLFRSCHCLLMEIVSCWQAVSSVILGFLRNGVPTILRVSKMISWITFLHT